MRSSTKTQTLKLKQGLPPSPCPTFSPGITWPYCRRVTDGLLAQNDGTQATKSLLRSRCLLPLDICPQDGAGWMGNGGEDRRPWMEGVGWRDSWGAILVENEKEIWINVISTEMESSSNLKLH